MNRPLRTRQRCSGWPLWPASTPQAMAFPFSFVFRSLLGPLFFADWFFKSQHLWFFGPVKTHDDAHTPSVTNTPSHRHTVIHTISRRTLACRQALEATLGEIREWCVYKFKLLQNIRFATSHNKYCLESVERRQLLTVVWIILKRGIILSLRIKQVCFKTQFLFLQCCFCFADCLVDIQPIPNPTKFWHFLSHTAFCVQPNSSSASKLFGNYIFQSAPNSMGFKSQPSNQTSTWNSSPDSAFFSSTAATESPHLFLPEFLVPGASVCPLLTATSSTRCVFALLVPFSTSNLRTFFLLILAHFPPFLFLWLITLEQSSDYFIYIFILIWLIFPLYIGVFFLY